MFEDSKEQKLYVAFELQSLHGFEKSTKAQYYFKKTLFVYPAAIPRDGL